MPCHTPSQVGLHRGGYGRHRVCACWRPLPHWQKGAWPLPRLLTIHEKFKRHLPNSPTPRLHRHPRYFTSTPCRSTGVNTRPSRLAATSRMPSSRTPRSMSTSRALTRRSSKLPGNHTCNKNSTPSTHNKEGTAVHPFPQTRLRFPTSEPRTAGLRRERLLTWTRSVGRL